MDVEIAKKNGEVFRLSDYGVVQDFVVNSIDKRTHRENIDGRPGAVNYGSYDGDRTITVPFIFKAYDLHDYAHLRDELYGLLDDGEPFYIRELRRLNYLQYEFVDFGEAHTWSPGTDNQYVNGKQILVRLNSVISPEQEFKNGRVVLEFISDELPYFESIYTTLYLHETGFNATAEKYGLADNIDTDKINYRYEPDLKPNMIPLTQDAWEDGGYSTSTGDDYNISARLRLKRDRAIKVVKGETYTIHDDSTTVSGISAIDIFQYENGEYLGTSNWLQFDRRGEITFEAAGNEILIAFRPQEGVGIPPRFINHADERIRLKLEHGDTFTGFIDTAERFNIYNAGNVIIEPEAMFLDIRVYNLNAYEGFSIKNLTTGDEFILNRRSDGFGLRINGMVVSLGAINNIFRDTNKRFISLAPGDNEFEVSGGIYSYITFDFKYRYK